MKKPRRRTRAYREAGISSSKLYIQEDNEAVDDEEDKEELHPAVGDPDAGTAGKQAHEALLVRLLLFELLVAVSYQSVVYIEGILIAGVRHGLQGVGVHLRADTHSRILVRSLQTLYPALVPMFSK